MPLPKIRAGLGEPALIKLLCQRKGSLTPLGQMIHLGTPKNDVLTSLNRFQEIGGVIRASLDLLISHSCHKRNTNCGLFGVTKKKQLAAQFEGLVVQGLSVNISG